MKHKLKGRAKARPYTLTTILADFFLTVTILITYLELLETRTNLCASTR